MGVHRPKTASARAINAVLAQKVWPDKYTTDEGYWIEFGSSRASFVKWREELARANGDPDAEQAAKVMLDIARDEGAPRGHGARLQPHRRHQGNDDTFLPQEVIQYTSYNQVVAINIDPEAEDFSNALLDLLTLASSLLLLLWLCAPRGRGARLQPHRRHQGNDNTFLPQEVIQ